MVEIDSMAVGVATGVLEGVAVTVFVGVVVGATVGVNVAAGVLVAVSLTGVGEAGTNVFVAVSVGGKSVAVAVGLAVVVGLAAAKGVAVPAGGTDAGKFCAPVAVLVQPASAQRKIAQMIFCKEKCAETWWNLINGSPPW